MPTLDWIGKKAVVGHHNGVPFHLLQVNEELSAGDPNSGNLLIEGDSLLALKALLPYYAGQVKCIYICPPYNTGNENWVYNDNVNSPAIREWLGKVVGADAEDLSRHDKWLCMMYPRLLLLRDFLREDGAIFVSIDDNEVHNARAVLSEIFGELNSITSIAWQKIYTVKSSGRHFSEMHDCILVYAKDSASGPETCSEGPRNRTELTQTPTTIPEALGRPLPFTHATTTADVVARRFRRRASTNPTMRRRVRGSLANCAGGLGA